MKIVIALGGNALGYELEEQKRNIKKLVKSIFPIFSDGHKVVLTHGNGPQVGLINLAFEKGKSADSKVVDMGLSECGAMSQGYIGYHLQNELQNVFNKEKLDFKCCSIITQVLVDKDDEAFLNPTKPIGSFYTYEESLKMPYVFKNDANRGYRRVVASPKPLKIIEKEQIQNLIDNNFIVIACGGGGIPVIEKDNELIGIDAVIDKDLSSAQLANDIDADILMILTTVENAKINFGKDNEKGLGLVQKEELLQYYENGEFAAGSMGPKVKACLNFANKNNKTAIITNIESAYDSLSFNKGTVIKG